MNTIAILEGMLFIVGSEGLSFEDLTRALSMEPEQVSQLLVEYDLALQEENRGLMLVQFGNKYKLSTKKEHHQYYEKLNETNNAFNFSNASLETLSIIAYNQPITRLEVENIRGVNCDHIIRRLQSFSLIKEAGRKDSIGKPMMYEVTDEFLDTFNLSSLDELPVLNLEVDEDEGKNIFHTRYVEPVGENSVVVASIDGVENEDNQDLDKGEI